MKKKIILISLVVLILLGTVLFFTSLNKDKVKSLTITEAGVYENLKDYDVINIESDGVTLKNTDINKLNISSKVKNGKIHLESVNASSIKIKGDVSSEVYFKGTKSNNLNVEFMKGKIFIDSKSSIKKASIEELDELSVSGSVDTIEVNGLNKIATKSTAKVKELNLNSKVEVEINSVVEKVNVSSKIKDVTIDISSKGVIKSLSSDIKTVLNGTGKVESVITKDNSLISGEITVDEMQKAYIVTFDSNGGSDVESITTADVAIKPENPSRNGYTFVSWQLNGEDYNFATKVTGNITLKAVWNKNAVKPAAKTYTVTFDSAGGSSVGNKTVTENNAVSKPGNPTRSGYKFIEWQLNGNNYNFSNTVTKNITLKALWEEIKVYTVKIELIDSATNPSRKIVPYLNGTKFNGVKSMKTIDGVSLGSNGTYSINVNDIHRLNGKVVLVLNNNEQIIANIVGS